MHRSLSFIDALPTSEALAEARVRYARERLDFHDYFRSATLNDIRRVFTSDDATPARRKAVLRKLLIAQQNAPHDLWVLLVVDAMKDVLAERRDALAGHGNVRLEKLLVRSLVEALREIPATVAPRALITHVLRFSEAVLGQSVRRARGPLITPSDRRAGKKAAQ